MKIIKTSIGLLRSVVLINSFLAFMYALGMMMCYGHLPEECGRGWYIVVSMLLFFAEYSYRIYIYPFKDERPD